MTNEEARAFLQGRIDLIDKWYPQTEDYREALDMAIKALEQTKWIPVSDPLNELPKDRILYVTTKFECVETLFYDMTEWSDVDIARNTIAYMDYYEPQPYSESEDKE